MVKIFCSIWGDLSLSLQAWRRQRMLRRFSPSTQSLWCVAIGLAFHAEKKPRLPGRWQFDATWMHYGNKSWTKSWKIISRADLTHHPKAIYIYLYTVDILRSIFRCFSESWVCVFFFKYRPTDKHHQQCSPVHGVTQLQPQRQGTVSANVLEVPGSA